MCRGVTRIGLVISLVGLASPGRPAYASTFALKATRVNDVAVDPPRGTVSALPGDTIEVEIFISGWAAEIPGGVRAFQAGINNRDGAGSGFMGTILPLGWDASADPRFCTDSSECEPKETCAGGLCVGPGHDPSLGAFIDSGREDFLLAGRSVTSGVTTAFQSYDYFATASDGTVSDPGSEAYGGTLILVVSELACGVFTFNLLGQEDTFLADESGNPFYPASLVPLTINVDTCPPLVVGSDPPNCAVDAGVPSELHDAGTEFGWDGIALEFDSPTASMTCSDFSITTEPFGVPPQCMAVEPSGNTIRIILDWIIAPGRWTCFLHKDSNSNTCLGYLAGDTDASLVTEASDVAALVADLGGATPPMALHQCDVDRSNVCAPLDVLSTIDVLNGAEEFDQWDGAAIPAECPSP